MSGAIAEQAPTLLLWGRIALRIEALPASEGYRKLVCEHPYNVCFIDNPSIQRLFCSVSILRAPG